MIDIVVNGARNYTQSKAFHVSQRIRELLAPLPAEIKTDCYIVMQGSTRVRVNSRWDEKLGMLIVGDLGTEQITKVAEALAPMEDEFDIRLTDSVTIESHKELTTALQAL